MTDRERAAAMSEPMADRGRAAAMSEPMPHRERAVHDLAVDLAVTAGAGAGKTTVLVDRFVKIAYEPGLGPDRILAITFTRKAAAEMKERVIRRFEERGDIERRRATEAAYISTIHGFAERVLREHPFEARIDPAFQVLTEYDQQLFVEDALASMYARDDLRAHAQRLGKEYRGGWRIFSVVGEVSRLLREGPEAARREADAIGDAEACVRLALARAEEHVAVCEREALERLAALVPLLANATFKSRKGMYELAQRYLDEARRCTERGTLSAAADPGIWRQTTFTGQIEPAEREGIKAVLGAIKDATGVVLGYDPSAQEALERELLGVKRAIYDAARAVDEAYRRHKRRSGLLDFHDLQLRARELFATVGAVRDEYAARFRHVLLDESQDTDELQHGLVAALRATSNVLFMVGDPKQAIYEFRGADPDVFQRELLRLPENDRLELPDNFRSRLEIVSFINGLGPALLPGQFTRIVRRADYGGTEVDGAAVTSVLAVRPQTGVGASGKPTYEPLADARAREAAAVAEEVVRLLQSSTPVRDPDRKELAWVPLRPRHVAVLFRTRTAVPYFERAFADRGVPYVTASGEGFYDRAEVLDCMSVLRALEQPLDDLALAALLRSPFVGASDEDLLELRELAGGDRPLYRGLRRHPRLRAFRERWDAMRRAQRGRPALDALDAVIADCEYEGAIAAHADGPAMLANLAKLRRQLRDLGAVSSGAAWAELERRRELMEREAQAALVGAADDVVVFSTIHQAKGLEWPVVCLPNLQAPLNRSTPAFSARHGVLTLEALDGDGEKVRPLSIRAIEDDAKRRAEQEERRLFYVALTRARERLVLSASPEEQVLARTDEDHEKKRKAPFSAPLDFVLAHTEGTLVKAGEHDCGSYRTSVRHVHDVPPRTPYEGGEPLARTLVPRVVADLPRDPPPALTLPLAAKVTELLAFRRCPQVYRFAHELEIDEHLRKRAAVRGGAATVSPVGLGTIVHRLLERARFDAPDLDAEATRLLAAEDPTLHDRLRPMLHDVLHGGVGDAVRRARRVEREWPFATMIGDVLLEGVIDLAVQGDDGCWTVFDYKSNDYSRTGRLEYLVEYYTPQLELYAHALSRAGVGEVAECALVFLIGGRVERWSFDASASLAEAWAVEAITRIAAREYATSAGPKCEMCGYRKRKVCAIGQG